MFGTNRADWSNIFSDTHNNELWCLLIDVRATVMQPIISGSNGSEPCQANIQRNETRTKASIEMSDENATYDLLIATYGSLARIPRA